MAAITPSCVQDRSKAFSFFSSAGVGSLGRDLYVFASARRVLIFPSHVVQSITTVVVSFARWGSDDVFHLL